MTEHHSPLISKIICRVLRQDTKDKPDKLASLERISDQWLRREQFRWYCKKQKVVFRFSLGLLCILVGVAVFVILGPFPMYLKSGSLLILLGMVKAVWRYLINEE
jgi:hypothetical protein